MLRIFIMDIRWSHDRLSCIMGIATLHTTRATYHDDVIKWKHFPRYWPFVRGIHRSPVNSPHKGQWRGALIFSLICICINGWVNNREAGDLRRYRAHYDGSVMLHIYNLLHNKSTPCCWAMSCFRHIILPGGFTVIDVPIFFKVDPLALVQS